MDYIKHVTNTKTVLKYEIFLKCKNLSKDDFWKNLYEELAYNGRFSAKYTNSKTNKIIKIEDTNIVFGSISYYFKDKTPQEIINELQPLINENTKFMSKTDIKNKNIKLENERLSKYKELINKNSFSSIKIKSWRKKCLIDYVLMLGKKYSIPDNKLKIFYDSLNYTFLTKAHNSKDVVYKDGKILDIKGIKFVNGELINSRFNIIINDDKNTIKNKKNTIQSDWETFVEKFDLYCNKLLNE